MNRYIKLAVSTLLAVSLLSACTAAEKTPDTKGSVVQEATEDTVSEDNAKSHDNTSDETDFNFIQKFSEFMNQQPDATQLAAFMQSNLNDAAPDEAELALSRLLLSQEAVSNDWMNMMMDDRLKGFQEMGYQWDVSSLEKIQDPNIRVDYQYLIDSYMRVQTYEETPVVENDWRRLAEFSPYMSEAGQLLIEINAKVQNYDYGAYPSDFRAMADDALALEEVIKDRQADYLSYQMNKAYNGLIGEIFYSIEGINMEYWADENGPLIPVLADVARNNPNSDFGRLCEAFVKKQQDTTVNADLYNTLGSVITNHNAFGLQSSLEIHEVSERIGNRERSVNYIYCPHDTYVEEKINKAMDKAFDTLRSDLTLTEDSPFTIRESSYPSFTNSKYFSTGLFVSYTDADGNYISTDTTLVFDVKTGRQLTLDTFLGLERSTYAPVLIDKIKELYIADRTFVNDLNELPDSIKFDLNDMGLSIIFDKYEVSDDFEYQFHAFIPHYELQGLYDVIELYE